MKPNLDPLAGLPVPASLLCDVAQLERDYYELKPDPLNPTHAVSFGTSGHRGTSTARTFNEDHILAITQAVCDYREKVGTNGPVLMGMDTHALSAAAQRTALRVLAANGVSTLIQKDGGFTPTPAISHAILAWNRSNPGKKADGLIITPSHNPPADGGFKYNPPEGGPADTDITGAIQKRANELLAGNNSGVLVKSYEEALAASTTEQGDFIMPYVEDLGNVIDMAAIAASGLRIGVDPLGGAALAYWKPIAERYGLNITVVNTSTDPQFGFMTVDHDGQVRMDCSSPYAMASLVGLKDNFAIAWGTDPDADRHGIVTASRGLLNPNHFLAVAIDYLLKNRPGWPKAARVGKTLVSSTLIDRVVQGLGGHLSETPVGFKWFAGLFDGTYCFGGEESAGASFLRRDGTVWTTDKDGILLGLLAAEITAVTGADPGKYYRDLASRYGFFYYDRVDNPATPAQKAAFKNLTPEAVTADVLAGDHILHKITHCDGNPTGGLKVVTGRGWFAARPSGTEAKYKVYAESYVSQEHLEQIFTEAGEIVAEALAKAPAPPTQIK